VFIVESISLIILLFKSYPSNPASLEFDFSNSFNIGNKLDLYELSISLSINFFKSFKFTLSFIFE